MWQNVILGLVGGVIGGNAFPHFVRGITKERYPNLTGNGPLPNFIGGWSSLVLAGFVIFYWRDPGQDPVWTFVSAAVGVLLIGLFHAGPGAFGRRETASPSSETPIHSS